MWLNTALGKYTSLSLLTNHKYDEKWNNPHILLIFDTIKQIFDILSYNTFT